jgi:hypothetical protein
MVDKKKMPGGPHDTGAYSASKAPETLKEAQDREHPSDERLVPGGEQGSDEGIGMSGLDRDELPSGGDSAGQTSYGDTEKAK